MVVWGCLIAITITDLLRRRCIAPWRCKQMPLPCHGKTHSWMWGADPMDAATCMTWRVNACMQRWWRQLIPAKHEQISASSCASRSILCVFCVYFISLFETGSSWVYFSPWLPFFFFFRVSQAYKRSPGDTQQQWTWVKMCKMEYFVPHLFVWVVGKMEQSVWISSCVCVWVCG